MIGGKVVKALFHAATITSFYASIYICMKRSFALLDTSIESLFVFFVLQVIISAEDCKRFFHLLKMSLLILGWWKEKRFLFAFSTIQLPHSCGNFSPFFDTKHLKKTLSKERRGLRSMLCFGIAY